MYLRSEEKTKVKRQKFSIILNNLLNGYVKQSIFQDKTSYHNDKQLGFDRSVGKYYTYQYYTNILMKYFIKHFLL